MNKKILISSSIIIILALYIIIANVKRSSDVPDLKKWEGTADEIIITRSGGTIQLLKKEGKWVVGDKAYPADAKAVNEMEKRFKEIHLTDLISTKGYYVKYDLTPDKYAEVIIKKNGAIFRKFKIGKKQSTNRHTFIRIDDRPDIYLAEGTFDLVLDKSPEDFRDKEILKIKPDSVSAFKVDYQGRYFAFSREVEKKSDVKDTGKKTEKRAPKPAEEKWICQGNETVALDKSRVEALLQSLDPLRALSFPEMHKETLTQGMCTVRIKAHQKDILITVYKKDEKYLVTTSESPYIFGVEKWNIEKFFITGLDDLKITAQ